MKYYAYVLLCSDGSLYKGFTNNLEYRFHQHITGKGAEYTKKHRPLKIAYYEVLES